jgi:hypothetical protein
MTGGGAAMTEMSSCGNCGDRWPHGEVHNCWVKAKEWTQENFPAPQPSDFVPSYPTRAQSDAEWYESHGHAD